MKGEEKQERENQFSLFFSELSLVSELFSGQRVTSRVTALDSLPLDGSWTETPSLSWNL